MSVGGSTTVRGEDRDASADRSAMGDSSSHATWGYRPGLDGLRAVAVVAVVLYHDGIRRMPGGFLGVDVFFALSGFLITSLLLAERDRTDRIALVEFWARRFRRLLPALLLLFVGITLYEFFAESIFMIPTRREDAPWVLAYLTNWRFITSDASYFEAFSAPNPFRHLWSLAIEEQLYLLWPPVVAFALWLRRGKSDVLLITAGVLAVASAVLMTVLIPALGDPTRSYYGTDTRAQTVLVGAVAAILLRGRTLEGSARRLVAMAGLVASVVMVLCFVLVHDTDLRMYQGGFLAFAVAATVVVVDAAHPGSPVASVLSLRPLRWIGAISYGIYLWHWPIHLWINPLRFDLSFPVILLIRAGLTVAIAWLSFHLVERPVRRWFESKRSPDAASRRPRSPWITIGAAVGCIGLAALAYGWTQRTVTTPDGRLERALRGEPAAVTRTVEPSDVRLPDGFGPLHPLTLTAVGDSTGFTLAEPNLLQGVTLRNGAVLGCGATTGEYYFGDFPRALPPQCATVDERWASHASADSDAILVFLGGWEVFDPRVDGRRLGVTSDEWHQWFTGELRQRIETMQAASPRDVPIALVEVPCPTTDTMRVGLGAWERADPDRVAAVNRSVRDLAEEMGPQVRSVSYADQVCSSDGEYLWRDAEGDRPRPDGLHAEGPARVRIWQSLIDQLGADLQPAS